MQAQMPIKHLLWRNTKEEVKLFHSVPPSEEETIFAEFSQQERKIYDSKPLFYMKNSILPYLGILAYFNFPASQMNMCLGNRREFTVNNQISAFIEYRRVR